VDDISDIVEVEVTAGMTEEEKTRARCIHKRRFISCILTYHVGPGPVRLGLICFKDRYHTK